MKESALFLPDIDEGGLNTGKDGLDPAEVDVSDGTTMIGTIHQQLYQPVVFQDGHAGLPLAPIDQDLALQRSRPRLLHR
jgi:hypothetical protein